MGILNEVREVNIEGHIFVFISKDFLNLSSKESGIMIFSEDIIVGNHYIIFICLKLLL